MIESPAILWPMLKGKARSETMPAACRAAVAALLVVVTYLAFFHDLDAIRLVDETEPIFAETSWQMLTSGDWVRPVFNGSPRYDKPPLVYWLQAASFVAVGRTELGARLPSATAAAAVAFLLFIAVLRLGRGADGEPGPRSRADWGAAAVAALAWILSPEAWVWGRTAVSDMVLTAAIAAAMLAAAMALHRGSGRWWLAAVAACGVGALAKGPIAPALVGSASVLAIWRLSAWSTVRRTFPAWTAAVVFGAVVLPWYGLITLRDGRAFVQSFVGYHNVERFLSVVNGHAGPWWFYGPVFVVGFMPWVVLLPRAVGLAVRRSRRSPGHAAPSTVLTIVALAWLVSVLGVFTLARTKLPSYVLPAMPAAAVLTGLGWRRVFDSVDRRDNGGGVLEAAAAALACWGLSWALWRAPEWLMSASDSDTRAIGQFVAREGLHFTGAVALAAFGAGCAAIAAARRARWLPVLLAGASATVLAAVVLPAARVADEVRQRPLYELAIRADTIAPAGRPLVMVGFWKPSLTFYARRRVVFLTTFAEFETYRATRASGPSVVIAEAARWYDEGAVIGRAGRYVLASR